MVLPNVSWSPRSWLSPICLVYLALCQRHLDLNTYVSSTEAQWVVIRTGIVSGCNSSSSWQRSYPITTDRRGDPPSPPTAPQRPALRQIRVSASGHTRPPSPHRTRSPTRCPWRFTAPFHPPGSRDIGPRTRPPDVGDSRKLTSSWPICLVT